MNCSKLSSTALRSLVVLIAAGLCAQVSAASPGGQNSVRTSLQKSSLLRIPFIENQGQLKDRSVQFYANTFAGSVLLTEKGEIVYWLRKPERAQQGNEDGTRQSESRKRYPSSKAVQTRETLTNSQKPHIAGSGSSSAKVNYFKGPRDNWRTSIATWQEVSLGEVYAGINLKLRANGHNVEKLFTVHPGGRVEDIALKVHGAKGLSVNQKGELEVATELGPITYTRPVAYQEINGRRVEVSVAYSLAAPELAEADTGMSYGFKAGSYDKTHDLVIDPLLAATFLGGSGTEEGIELALDGSGNIVVAGLTDSPDFPTTAGAFDRIYGGGQFDVFVSKLNPAGDTLLFSTFIGGSDDEDNNDPESGEELYKFGMAVDNAGNVYVSTNTHSADFPTTVGAYDRTFNGGTSDVFVLKLSAAGDQLVYSTFLGGSGNEYGGGVAVDSDGSAYVAGETLSTDFPTTAGAYDETYNGGNGDIFVTKLNPSGSALVYSTYLGGSYWDEATDIAVDSSGNAYVLGGGDSADYPTTPGAYDPSYNQQDSHYFDIYLTKLNAAGNGLVYSTFLGGNKKDWAEGLALDGEGNAYVAGGTASSNFPVTPGAYATTFDTIGPGCSFFSKKSFITKFDATGSSLSYSTFIPHAGGMAIKVDSSGNACLGGISCSTAFPTTANAVAAELNGVMDAVVLKLNSSGNGLLYATYLGGSASGDGFELAYGIDVDAQGNIYVLGTTSSPDFPTQSPVQATYGGGASDAFVAIISESISSPPQAPTGLTAIATSSSQIVLGWTDTSDNETGFKIERKAGHCASTHTWAEIAAKGANTVTFTNNGLKANKTYAYRIRAYNDTGASVYSACVSAKTGLAGTPPAATGLTATATSSNKITLKWTDNSNNETGFKLYRKKGLEPWALLVTTDMNVRKYDDASALGNAASSSYRYYLTACNAAGCSPATGTAIVPFKPTGIKALSSGGKVKLEWTGKSSNETGFQVYRSAGTCASPGSWKLIATPAANGHAYHDSEVTAGTPYAYKVRAFLQSAARPCATGYSLYTGCVSATPAEGTDFMADMADN